MSNPMEMQMERARERERRLRLVESVTSDNAEMIDRLAQAFKVHVAKSDDNEPHEYRFRTADAAIISLEEISHDVTRAVPVLEVVVQGEKYQKFHYLLIHDSIVLKARHINHLHPVTYDMMRVQPTSQTVEAVRLQLQSIEVLQRLVSVAPAVSALDVGKIEMSFADIIECLVFVRDFKLHSIGAEAVTVVVRPR